MLEARNGSVVRTNVVMASESSLLPISGTFPRFLVRPDRRSRKKQQARRRKWTNPRDCRIYTKSDAATLWVSLKALLFIISLCDVEIARGEFVRASLWKMIKSSSSSLEIAQRTLEYHDICCDKNKQWLRVSRYIYKVTTT